MELAVEDDSIEFLRGTFALLLVNFVSIFIANFWSFLELAELQVMSVIKFLHL